MAQQKLIFVLVLVLSFAGVCFGKYSGGTGEPNDPYLIANAADINQIGANPDDWDAHFVLTADINLAEYTGTQFNIIGYYEDFESPNNVPFTGVFEGNNHTIFNFTYECINTSGIGLFRYIDDPNAEIKALTISSPNVQAAGNSYRVACLVGFLDDGTISNCKVEDCNVSGNNFTGGLVGDNYDFYGPAGTISNCYVTGSVSGHNPTGGLAGRNYSGTISNCYATSSVDGNEFNGGLVGQNLGTISYCYATGTINGKNFIGGLSGINKGTISNCYATGGASGHDYTGGLVGENYNTITNCYAAGNIDGNERSGGLVGCSNGEIYNCYATGAVSGGLYTGGVIGMNKGIIMYCYATGDVAGGQHTGGLAGISTGLISNSYARGGVLGDNYVGGVVGQNYGMASYCYSTGSVSGNTYVGGLVGENSLMVLVSFWDIETSGQLSSDGGTPKTTAEMKRQSTFLNAGWDLLEIWNIGENQTYPFLRIYSACDINHDDIVNFFDFAILAEHWLQSTE
jgi:hypothetical protein